MSSDLGHTPPLEEIDARLRTARPVPRPAFRGDLRRRLLAQGESEPAPRRLRLLITAYAGTGSALLAIAAIGVAGVGPFGA
jgi:hypothetical protein